MSLITDPHQRTDVVLVQDSRTVLHFQATQPPPGFPVPGRMMNCDCVLARGLFPSICLLLVWGASRAETLETARHTNKGRAQCVGSVRDEDGRRRSVLATFAIFCARTLPAEYEPLQLTADRLAFFERGWNNGRV